MNKAYQLSISNDLAQSSQSKRKMDAEVDANFRPIKILIHKNGDEFDRGTSICITRREFKHWIALLESITERTKSLFPINHLFSLKGEEIRHFKYLKDGGTYVGSINNQFKKCNYGKNQSSDWSLNAKSKVHDPQGLNSSESMDIYLRKLGYVSKTGKSFYENSRWSGSEFDIKMRQKRSLSEKPLKKGKPKLREGYAPRELPSLEGSRYVRQYSSVDDDYHEGSFDDMPPATSRKDKHYSDDDDEWKGVKATKTRKNRKQKGTEEKKVSDISND